MAVGECPSTYNTPTPAHVHSRFSEEKQDRTPLCAAGRLEGLEVEVVGSWLGVLVLLDSRAEGQPGE